MKTQAEYFKASDLASYTLDVLEPLRLCLSAFCAYNVSFYDLYHSDKKHITEIDYKKDIKPIFKSCGLEKGDFLREKLKKYIKSNSYSTHVVINRIVSILTKEIRARKSEDYVMYTYCKPITGKSVKNYYKTYKQLF